MCKYYLFKEFKFLKFIEFSEKKNSVGAGTPQVWEAGNFMVCTWVCSGPAPSRAFRGSSCSSPPPQCKEEAVGTLDAIQVLTGVSQLLPKSRENYLNRCMDQERLRRESANQKEMDKVGAQLQVPSHPGPRRPEEFAERWQGGLMGEWKHSTEPWLSNLREPHPGLPKESTCWGMGPGEVPRGSLSQPRALTVPPRPRPRPGRQQRACGVWWRNTTQPVLTLSRRCWTQLW